MASTLEKISRLWHHPADALKRPWLGWGAYIIKRFLDCNVLVLASALSYNALLALLPMIALGLAMLTSFEAFEDMRGEFTRFLLNNLVPTSSLQVEIHVNAFLENISQLTAVGVGGLLITSIALFSTIERAFNTIWHVRENKSWVRRILAFWTTLTLGPFLLAILLSISHEIATMAGQVKGGAEIIAWAHLLFSPLLSALFFMWLYLSVPNVSVPWRSALVGGLVVGMAFEAMRALFVHTLKVSANYELIYGALSVVPLVLVWLYVFWVMVLTGGIVAESFVWRRGLSGGTLWSSDPRKDQFQNTVLLLQTLWNYQKKTGEGLGTADLLERMPRPLAPHNGMLERLQKACILDQTNEERWVITADMASITLYDIYTLLGYSPSGSNADPLHSDLSALNIEARKILRASMAEVFTRYTP